MNVSSDTYNAFIDQVNLKSVYLARATVTRYRAPDVDKGLHFEEREGRRAYKNFAGGFEARYSYAIELHEQGVEAPFAKATCTFVVEYASEQAMTRKLFSVFKHLNVPLNTWPYIREFLQGMTQRMGVPTLVLPFIKR